MLNFNQKNIFITGASRGIGAEVARQFAKNGATVFANYFISDYESDAEENINNLVDEIQKTSGKIVKIHGDVSSEKDALKMFEQLKKENVTLDVIVNNAGYVIDKSFSEREIKDFERTINTNLIAPFLVSKIFLPILKHETGKIINITSTNGINCTYTHSLDYDASKAGLISLTKNLATEFAQYGINVNAIAPGWVATDMNKQLEKEFIKSEEEKILLKRFAETDEIAMPIMFLASDMAKYITGTVIVVDGGMKLI